VEKRRSNAIFAACLIAWLLAIGCASNRKENSQSATQEERAAAVQSSTPEAKTPASSDHRPVIVAFGDSLTAGVVQNTYPEYLQDMLTQHGYNYRVENQGVAGDTTTDGLARIENVIASHPALVVLEFGGNDGLRGIPVEATRKNMEEMITRLKDEKLPVVLLGITLPPNYGPDYVQPFTAMFPSVAKKFNLRLFPFLLVDVYQHPEMMQPDGIHPNGEGNQIVAQDVFKFITPVLKKQPAARTSSGL
jgi:acyl-CoA thioesterase-1